MSVRQFEEERQERERKLKSENERLRKENTDLSKIVLDETYDEFTASREIKSLREALKFYADERNWEFHSNNFDVHDDRGMLARKALGDSK